MSESTVTHLVLVDHSLSDTDTIVRTLQQAGLVLQEHRAHQAAQLHKILRSKTVDLILVRCDQKQADLPSLSTAREYLDQIVAEQAEYGEVLFCALIALDQPQADTAQWLREGADSVAYWQDSDHLVRTVKRELSFQRMRKRLAELEVKWGEADERIRNLMNHSRDAIAFIHEGLHANANPAYLKLFNYASEEDLRSVPLLNLIAPTAQNTMKSAMRETFRGKQLAPLEVEGVTADGRRLGLRMLCSPITINNEPCLQIQIQGEAEVRQTPGQQKALEAKIASLEQQIAAAYQIDSFTNLLSRQYFLESLEAAFLAKLGGAVLYVLLTDYRSVSEKQGLQAIDVLILDLAKSLRATLAPTRDALLSHFSDAAFVAYLPGASLDEGKEIAEIMSAEIQEHRSRWEQKLVATASAIGICEVRTYHRVAAQLISQADRACETARRKGANQIFVFEHEKQTDSAGVETRDALAEKIANAIQNQRTYLRYQPIACLDRELGLDPRYKVYLTVLDGEKQPFDLKTLQQAEQFNLMPPLDRVTIEQALAAAASAKVKVTPMMFVRLSANALNDKAFHDWLVRYVDSNSVSGKALVLEVQEETAEQQFDGAKSLRTRLRPFGCGFAISHFGGKPNSEILLNSLLPNYVKLDISFIEKVVKSKDETVRASMKRLNELAAEKGIKLIASEIASPSQMTSIYQFGINLVQGDMIQGPSTHLDFDFAEYAG